jgi:hypothetical protein
VRSETRPAAQISGFAYRIFGLDFLSGEPIPGLAPTSGIAGSDAIRIEFGSVPVCIPDPEYADESVQATGAEYLLNYPKIGRIYVQGGERIVFERAAGAFERATGAFERTPDADPAGMWQFVLGVGATIAGFRRGFVPIHASAVVHGNDCVAFAGQSTAGKSTIAALLTTLGFGLHADDLCLAHWSGSRVDVGTGVPELKLCDDAVGMVGWNRREPAAYFADAGKSLFRLGTTECGPRPLRRIYVLEFASEANKPGIYPIGGVTALQALIDCLRIRLPLLMTGPAPRYFERMAAVSRAVELFRFVRPRDPEQSFQRAGRLAEHFDTQPV